MIEEETTTETSPPTGPASLGQRLVLFLVAAAVILVDHVSKLFIETQLPLNQSWAPIPELSHLFQFTHVSNTGAAFGLFPSGSLAFGLVAAVVAVFIVIYNYQLPAGHFWLRLALGLQLAGALGNLIDRVRQGHVTDFLDFGPWPVFNLADTSIVAGVVILGLLMLQEIKEEREMRERALAAEEPGSEQKSPMSRLQSPPHNEQAT